jgi:hypothetical protein
VFSLTVCMHTRYRGTAPRNRLARIIHQAEKSTGEGAFVIQMSHKTTVSQAYDAPKTISSGLPDTVHIGLRSATGRTASCQPPRAYLSSWHVSRLGSRSTSQGLRGQTHAGP